MIVKCIMLANYMYMTESMAQMKKRNEQQIHRGHWRHFLSNDEQGLSLPSRQEEMQCGAVPKMKTQYLRKMT